MIRVLVAEDHKPRLDGVEATRQFLDRCPGTRVLVLTGRPQSVRAAEALDTGAQRVLARAPISMS